MADVTVLEHSEAGWAYRVLYDDLGSCGCGQPVERLELVRDALRDCPLYDGTSRNWATPLHEWFLCLLDSAGLIEHGSVITGSWLTEKGTRLLTALNDEVIWSALVGDDDLGCCECEDCRDD